MLFSSGGKQMRKTELTICLLAAVMFTGCQKADTPEETPAPSEEPVETFSVWTVEPSMTYKSVKIPEQPYLTEVRFDTKENGTVYAAAQMDRKGYGQEWNGMGYTPDSVIVSDGMNQGIADYTGTEIYPLSIAVHSTPFAAGIVAGRTKDASGNPAYRFGAVNTASSSVTCFRGDFKTTETLGLADFNYDPFRRNTYPYFVIKNDVFGVAIPVLDAEGTFQYEYKFEQYTGPALGAKLIVPVVDDMYYTLKYVLCEENGKVLGDLAQGRGTYRENSFINGFYVIAQQNEATFIKVGTGQVGLTYNEAKYFQDGYAPVARNGKWAFLDEKGNEVCDFLFDDALPLYNGKSWVKYDGKWGILDVRSAVEHDGGLTISNCFPCEEDVIGTVQVNVSSLSIRTGPATSKTKAGMCRKNAVYQVYETSEGEGYTWYRVGNGLWVPNDGKWLTYTAKVDSGN